MIVLDIHIWVWWIHEDPQLTQRQNAWIQEHEEQGLGVSAISCWEVAKLVEYHRLTLPCPMAEWIDQALGLSRHAVATPDPSYCGGVYSTAWLLSL